MAHVAYRWNGDLFCEGDIVGILTDHEPWKMWCVVGNDPGDADAETELDDIADLFGIDRYDPAQVAEHGFPVRLSTLPKDFCSVCLNWFQ